MAKLFSGAIQGQPSGRQGQSYAIITKELRPDYPPVTLDQVRAGVNEFLVYAREHPFEKFQVTRIGCGLAGFTEEQIAPMFWFAPPNCDLPEGWRP
jgi:hypothetical protein